MGGAWSREEGGCREVQGLVCGGAREPGASQDSRMGVSTPKTVGSLRTTGGVQSD